MTVLLSWREEFRLQNDNFQHQKCVACQAQFAMNLMIEMRLKVVKLNDF